MNKKMNWIMIITILLATLIIIVIGSIVLNDIKIAYSDCIKRECAMCQIDDNNCYKNECDITKISCEGVSSSG